MESPAVSAVAVGLTTDDAHILATRGFLERLDLDERQAVVAHLVGSVGNGDLEIAAGILSVFQTWGLMALLLEAPFARRHRGLLAELVRLSWTTLRGPVDPERARAVANALLGGAAFEVDEMVAEIEAIHPRSVWHGCFIIVVQIPLIATLSIASIAARQVMALCTTLVLGPWLAAMWRARRRLAGATAVQLTRHPAALASAGRVLEASDVEVPGGWAVNFLFPVWPPVTEKNAHETAAAAHIVGMRLEAGPRLERLAALGATVETERSGLPGADQAAARSELKDLLAAVGWAVVAVLLSAVLIVSTLAAASLLLMVVWHVLLWLSPFR